MIVNALKVHDKIKVHSEYIKLLEFIKSDEYVSDKISSLINSNIEVNASC